MNKKSYSDCIIMTNIEMRMNIYVKNGKTNVLLGVTGGIASYKIATLASLLVKGTG